MEYQVLRKQYWGQHIWAMGCFCVSSGNETDDMIKNYIQNHDERDDSFSVEGEQALANGLSREVVLLQL